MKCFFQFISATLLTLGIVLLPIQSAFAQEALEPIAEVPVETSTETIETVPEPLIEEPVIEEVMVPEEVVSTKPESEENLVLMPTVEAPKQVDVVVKQEKVAKEPKPFIRTKIEVVKGSLPSATQKASPTRVAPPDIKSIPVPPPPPLIPVSTATTTETVATTTEAVIVEGEESIPSVETPATSTAPIEEVLRVETATTTLEEPVATPPVEEPVAIEDQEPVIAKPEEAEEVTPTPAFLPLQ